MKQGLSLKTRQRIFRGFANEYAKGTNGQKGVMLDYLCASTGWSRVNARRRLATEAAKPAMGAPVVIPKRRPGKYGPASIMLLGRIWTLSGEPCGKYLALIMAETLGRLERFEGFGAQAPLLSDGVGSSCVPCQRRALTGIWYR